MSDYEKMRISYDWIFRNDVRPAKSIGYDARVTGGFYVNTNSARSPHAWTAILIDGGWYFFDPHIEANNLMRNRNTSGYNPRIWWKQPVGAQQTQSRYDSRHDFTSIPQAAPAPVTVHTDNEISVTINGVAVIFEDQQPTIVDGRTLIPVRGVFEALGFEVDWDGYTATASLSRHDYAVFISIGSATFLTNGTSHALDVPAQIINGRTIGTPATRAEIIETLLKQEYVVRKDKHIIATEKGISVIENKVVPDDKKSLFTSSAPNGSGEV